MINYKTITIPQNMHHESAMNHVFSLPTMWGVPLKSPGTGKNKVNRLEMVCKLQCTINISYARNEFWSWQSDTKRKISMSNWNVVTMFREIRGRCPRGFGPPGPNPLADLVPPDQTASGFGLPPRIWSPLFSRYIKL